MLKLAGAGLIVWGCVGLGKRFLWGYRGRMEALQELSNILELMAGVINYEKSSLPQCCERVAEHLNSPFAEQFRSIAGRMKENEGVSFGMVFRQEMEDALRERPVKQGDIEKFWEFAEMTGFADGEMQVRSLRRSMEKLQEERQKLADEEKEKSKVVKGLSIMSGLLIILILW